MTQEGDCMAKVKIEVVGAYIDGHAPGSKIDVEEKSANHLERIGYAKIVKGEPKPSPRKKALKKTESK